MPLVSFPSPYLTHMPGVHVCRMCVRVRVCRCVCVTRCAADWRRKLLLRQPLPDCVIAPKGKVCLAPPAVALCGARVTSGSSRIIVFTG